MWRVPGCLGLTEGVERRNVGRNAPSGPRRCIRDKEFPWGRLPQRRGRRVPLQEVLRTGGRARVQFVEEAQATAFWCNRSRQTAKPRRAGPSKPIDSVVALTRGTSDSREDAGRRPPGALRLEHEQRPWGCPVGRARARPAPAAPGTDPGVSRRCFTSSRAARTRHRSSIALRARASEELTGSFPPLGRAWRASSTSVVAERHITREVSCRGLHPALGPVFHVSGLYREKRLVAEMQSGPRTLAVQGKTAPTGGQS